MLAAPLIPAAISYFSAKSQNRQQTDLSRQQMAFQERMSSTAYQRSAADMEKAGLNRILAAGGPASSPAGAMAQMVNPGQQAVTSGLEASKTQTGNALTRAKTAIAKTEQILKDALVPGAKTLKLMTTNAFNILKAADDILKENSDPPKEILQQLTDSLGKTIGEAAASTRDFENEVKVHLQRTMKSEKAQEYFTLFKTLIKAGGQPKNIPRKRK